MNPELSKRIKAVDFPKEYWPRPTKPTQICLHHTASAPGVYSDVAWWKQDGTQVSTPLIVDRDGTAYQLYSTLNYAFALGLKHAAYRTVEALTISLEIDSWGYLTKKADGKFYSWAGTEVKPEDVCTLDTLWRGQKYFHKYTDAQIETTRLLLEHWGSTYGIDLKYKGDEVFNLSQNAIYASKSGVYSHASFRSDKTDCHPQKELIAMLKSF